MDDVQIYSNGIVHCSVCVPKDMPREQVEAIVNIKNPAGTRAGWIISAESEFNGGGANPSPCNEDPKRLHYLMAC